MNKVSYYLEKFWLIVGITTTLYALYLLFKGEPVRTVEYVLPIIAFVLYYTRRVLRKRIERSGQE